MNRILPIFATLSIALLAGCETSSETSPRGMATDENSFRMTVPATVQLHQGDVQSINVGLSRGNLFKQDVRINVDATPGIKADPATTTIKASQGPDAVIKLSAAKDAPLGEYRITVTGTPAAGTPATTEFQVRVVQP